MRFLLGFLCFFSFATPVEADAADFCEEEQLVVDASYEWNFEDGFLHTIALPTHRAGQLVSTRAELQLGNGGGEELFGIYEFPRRPNEVGLAYNLYRLQIQIGGDDEPDRQLIDQDYTNGCSGPGVALWPGSRLELQPIRLQPHAGGVPRALETVHVRFWGK